MNFRYLSEIQGAEANMIYPFGNFQLLAGFRYLEIDEQITLTSFDVDAGTGTFTANSFNNLYGGQIGILGQWQAFGLVDFDFFAKFGVFENYAQERQVLNDPIFFRDTFGHHSEAAYVTELAPKLSCRWGRRSASMWATTCSSSTALHWHRSVRFQRGHHHRRHSRKPSRRHGSAGNQSGIKGGLVNERIRR